MDARLQLAFTPNVHSQPRVMFFFFRLEDETDGRLTRNNMVAGDILPS